LEKRFNVQSFPAVFYIKNGKVIAKELGSRTSKEIKENVQKYFK